MQIYKHIIGILVLVGFVAVTLGAGVGLETLRERKLSGQSTVTYKTYFIDATTTEQYPARLTHTFDSELATQGVCIKIQDADGNGYTYLTTNNGTATFKPNSCE